MKPLNKEIIHLIDTLNIDDNAHQSIKSKERMKRSPFMDIFKTQRQVKNGIVKQNSV